MLRRKEWKLLRRDKWLMSQTLMQLTVSDPAGIHALAQFRVRAAA